MGANEKIVLWVSPTPTRFSTNILCNPLTTHHCILYQVCDADWATRGSGQSYQPHSTQLTSKLFHLTWPKGLTATVASNTALREGKYTLHMRSIYASGSHLINVKGRKGKKWLRFCRLQLAMSQWIPSSRVPTVWPVNKCSLYFLLFSTPNRKKTTKS